MNRNKVLVTGGQGFIGSYVCCDLLEHGYEVVSIDNYSKYGKVIRPQDDHPNFSLIECDAKSLEDYRSISRSEILEDVNIIIAGAAMIGGITYFNRFPYDLLATNERIMASTFDFAIDRYKAGQLDRILVLSSSMVFESTDVYPTPESEIKTCPPPLSTYGFQKLATEYFCKGANEQYGVPYTIIRPFNCIGVGEDEALGGDEITQGNIKMLMSHVVPDLIYKSLVVGKDGPLPILGKGNQVRHYTHGTDIARGIRIAMESELGVNNDFNISSDVPLSVIELANIIWKQIYGDVDINLSHEEPLEYDVQIRSPDTSKAKEVLGFTCEKSVEDVLPEIISWVKSQHNLEVESNV